MKKLVLSIISCMSLMISNVYGCEKHLAEQLVNMAKEKKLVITTAESCTGGMISAAITAVPGSSSVFSYGFVTYGNDAKEKMIGVQYRTIEEYGAVSEETAREMAIGALNTSKAHLSVAVTGIAGPGGGTEEKPVGLVYIAVATKDKVKVVKNNFTGDRNAIRLATTKKALEMSLEELQGIS